MPNWNRITMIGHLTRDPVLKHLSNQTPCTEFGIATNRKWGDNEEVCFVDCSSFGKVAELIHEHFAKGKPILVEGRLKYDTWEKDGQKRSKHSIVVENFTFVGGKDDGGEKPARTRGGQNDRARTRGGPATNIMADAGVTSEDIPF